MSDAEIHLIRGKLAWRRAAWRVSREDYLRAIKELERSRSAAQGRGDFTLHFLLGMSYVRLGRIAEGEELLRSARVAAPTFPGFLLTDALAADQTRKSVEPAQFEAVNVKFDAYMEALKIYPPGDAFAPELRFLGLLFRGLAYSRDPRLSDLAIKDLDAALETSREAGERPAAELISLLAQIHARLDQLGEAKIVVRDALARDPGESAHYYNMGMMLLWEHQPGKSKEWFDEAIARRPDFAEAHLKLADVARQGGDPASMRPHLEAFAAIQESRARAGFPVDQAGRADMEAGLGRYWVLVADKRLDDGDSLGEVQALAEAKIHFELALQVEPGCFAAIHFLIQIGNRMNAPAADIDRLKGLLEKLGKPDERDIDPYRSTFC